MGRIQRLFDQPLVMYLVIGTFSVFTAYLFWMIGGNFAKVVSDKPLVGVGFELGGALAGFVSVLVVSLLVFKELHKLEPPLRGIRVFLIPRDQFPAQENYSCKVRIYDREAGEERTLEPIPHREAGFLTIDLLDLRKSETFSIELRNSQEKSWESEFYNVAAPRAEMQPK